MVENLQREDLNPLERARGYKQLADMGLTQDQIAQKVGVKDRDIVYRYLALLDMPPEIQAMLPRGSITETHTRSIRQLQDKEQQIKVAQQAEKEGWSVKETEKRVNALLGKAAKGAETANQDNGKKGPVVYTTDKDPLEGVWRQLGFNGAVGAGSQKMYFPGKRVYYLGSFIWCFEATPQGVDMGQDDQEQLRKDLQKSLGQALIHYGRRLQGTDG